MKIKNLKLASLLVAMAMGSQGAFAQNVSSYENIQDAIQTYTSPITLSNNITQDTTTALRQFTGTKELNGASYTLSGMGTKEYTGIRNTGALTVNNITLSNFSTAVTNSNTLTISNSTLSNNTTAISNTAGTLNLESVTVANTNTNGLNLTGGTTNLSGTNTINNTITLSGNTTKLVNQGTTNVSGNISSSSGTPTIENSAALTLGGNNSNYTGSYVQNDGSTTVTGTFFGGNSTINNGTLNWNTENAISNAAKLIINGQTTTLNVNNGTLSLKNSSSIAAGVTTNITTNLNIDANGSATLSKGNWNGTVSLTAATGNLTIDGITQSASGVLNATAGNLSLNSGTTKIGTNGQIASNVKTNLASNATVDITAGGQVALNSNANDNWNGTVLVNGGSLIVDNRTSNGILKAETGSVTLTNGTLEIGKNTVDSSYIKGSVTTAINGGTLKITDGGQVALDNSDTWKGTLDIANGGALTLTNVDNTTNNGILKANGGEVTLNSTTLNINSGSNIAENVKLIIDNGSTVNINSSNVVLNGGENADTWEGIINLTGGTLTAKNISNTQALNATSGTLDIQENSNIKTNQIHGDVITKLANNAILDIIAGTDKKVEINGNDIWNGTINVKGGELVLNNATNNGILNAQTGKVNLQTGHLAIGTTTVGSSSIAKEVQTTISAGTFLDISEGGQVTLDGSTNDSWAGKVNISGGNLVIDNIANGTLVATGGNIDINAGTLTITGESTIENAAKVNIDAPAILLLQKDNLVNNITGSGTLDINGKKLTFNSNSHLDSTIKFKSENNASVIINNSTKANEVLEVVKAGANSGLNILLNSSNSNIDLTIDGSNITKLELQGTQSFDGALVNNGTVSNTGTLTLNGQVTGAGTFSNTGNITTGKDHSSYTGNFTQTAGSLTVDQNGKVFGGNKNISNSTLNITSDNVYYENVKLGNNGKLNHTGLTPSSVVNEIDSTVVEFVENGTGAKATFTNGNYNLTKIDNGKSNTIAITGGSTITLENTDYTGATIYDFTNSTLDLLENPDNGETVATNNYHFTELKTGGNTTLDFNVVITPDGDSDGGRKIVTDTITVDKTGAVFKFGNIYITGEENGKRGEYLTTDKNVLTGATFATEPGAPTITGATTKWVYNVTAKGNNSIALEIDNYADNNTLNDMNVTEGVRFFQFSQGDTEAYKVANSLDKMSEGRFNVTGNGKTQSVITGSKANSLFDIDANKDVELNIKNVTLQEAQKNGNGSVISNESNKAIINITNVAINENNSTGNGGAIYNGVMPEDPKTNNLVISGTDFNQNTAGGNGGAIYNAGNALISSTTFTANSGTNGGAIYNEGNIVINGVTGTTTFTDNSATGKGGAIYNKGDLTLNNVTIAAANGIAKNDIYQENGNTILTGTNKIASDITADAGTILNKGNTNISGNISGKSDITNEGTLNLTGDNSNHSGTFTQELTNATTTVTNKFFGKDSVSEISGGTLNWFTTNDIDKDAVLTMTGENANSTKLVIGENATQEAILSIGNGSSITDNVAITVNAKSTLNVIDQGTVTINGNDNWTGTIHVENNGNLTIKDFNKNNGTLTADGGELTITNSNITIAEGSHIQREVKTLIQNNSTVNITGDAVVLDGATGDIWDTTSTINVSGTGDLTIDDMEANGTITAREGKITLASGKLDIANKDSKIVESATVILNQNTTTNISNGGLLELNKGDDWSGTVNVIENGTLNINNVENNSTLTADGGTVNLKAGNITLDDTSSITYATKTIIDGNINIEGANIELNNNDDWNGNITITSGQLDLDNINGNGKIIAKDGGTINLIKGHLEIAKGSEIAAGSENQSTAINIARLANLDITGGNVTINDNDTWNGYINLKSGTLNIEEQTEGILHADGGNLNFTTGILTIKGDPDDPNGGSYIDLDVVVNLPEDSVIEILKGGTVAINDNDKWDGEIHLNGGVLNYGTTHSGTLTADKGDMNLLDGSILNIQIPSQVADEVNVDIRHGALVNLKQDAIFNLDENDKWNGMINNTGGKLTTTKLHNDTGNGGGLQQTSGSSTFQDNSHIFITNAESYITGGDLNILNNSSLFLGADTAELKVDNLKMEGNSLLNMMNDKINTSQIENMIVNDRNNVSINISPRDWKHDKFIINNIKSDTQGTINISDFDFLGLCPIDRQLKLRIFDANSIKNVTFDTTDKEIFTPIGWYDLKSVGGGYFTSNLTRYNPQVFRGQVATLAMYNNQLAVDDMLLNHVTLQSERFLAQGKNANRYAIYAPQFAPYQYRKEDGGLWFKNYVNFETLTMTQNLNVHNTAYGSIIGADLPVKTLKNGWEFMPTAYIGYNGSQQSFNNMHMYQNGGQAGFMGTFMKNDFVGSVLAYGGTYYNEMQVAGYKDEAMNWFAGTAAKAAYNIHASKHFTVQPTAFVSYNFFGKQNWGTDFGTMSMNSGMMNGVNIAPGVNFIYARETWNIYATLQYMYNINEGVSGNAGNVQLHDIRMRHGYIQYGVGATKTWKDRFNSYVQLVFRNGGRTGIGVQLGAQFLFDWNKPSKKNIEQTKQKSTIKTL